MERVIRNYLRSTFASAVVKAKSSDTFSNAYTRNISDVYYDTLNAVEFSDLYEHEKMLADSVRNDSYAEAIRRHVGPDDVVIDLGTGTGILAQLAARQGAKVYAIDHSPFIEIAEEIAEYNDADGIVFERVNSREFAPPEDVDVVLHEILGDDLFDENMVELLLDMKRRVLGDSGMILPGRFEMFVEPVTLKDDHRVPFIEEMTVQDIDFGFLRDRDIEKYKSSGYRRRWMDSGEFDSFLSTPEPVLSIDLNEMTESGSTPNAVNSSQDVTTPGKLDGFCLFFRVVFDDAVQFDTAPDHTNTSWGNRLFRAPSREFAEGDEISYTFSIGDISDAGTWSVSLN